MNSIVAAFFESDEERKKALNEKLIAEVLPSNMKLFDERLGKTGSGFFAASGMTWADLYLFSILDFVGDKSEPVKANFKNVKAMDEKVRAHPAIAAWLARRPKTDH